ncbi:uncharacterized protein LOC104902768 [Beta vulgaris subsp. vulgaris]|uniref:uncharacterized protein LOC104902768 n=1 Tax=Beta vulgaris subsp. vulgaris TaxID=3555 RepID=UPI0020367668|nr:uncharacterized protein LOC104902768 [Beta vulgaris subsp. vulgaris]
MDAPQPSAESCVTGPQEVNPQEVDHPFFPPLEIPKEREEEEVEEDDEDGEDAPPSSDPNSDYDDKDEDEDDDEPVIKRRRVGEFHQDNSSGESGFLSSGDDSSDVAGDDEDGFPQNSASDEYSHGDKPPSPKDTIEI